ncbi:MAG: DUF5320 domain-containing protein [bacterium]|jgi:hypothetical protein
MPGFDGTGPRGLGSMTGRGMGYCVKPVGELAAVRGGVGTGGTRYQPGFRYAGWTPYAGAWFPSIPFFRWPRRGRGRGGGRRGGRGRWW